MSPSISLGSAVTYRSSTRHFKANTSEILRPVSYMLQYPSVLSSFCWLSGVCSWSWRKDATASRRVLWCWLLLQQSPGSSPWHLCVLVYSAGICVDLTKLSHHSPQLCHPVQVEVRESTSKSFHYHFHGNCLNAHPVAFILGESVVTSHPLSWPSNFGSVWKYCLQFKLTLLTSLVFVYWLSPPIKKGCQLAFNDHVQ